MTTPARRIAPAADHRVPLACRIRALLRRVAMPRHYPRKRVLVLEGGGMRGVFTAGVLQGFHERGYFPWELIIGSSAGALNGVVYAAGQIHLARDAFLTELRTGRLFRMLNLLRTERHVINLDWLVDHILAGPEALDRRRLRRGAPVLLSATHCGPEQAPRTIYLSTRRDDIRTALTATAAIPFLYRGFVAYGGCVLLDGSLLAPLPFDKALALNYSEEDIVVVTTREKGYRKSRESFWIKALYEHYYRQSGHHYLLRALDERFRRYNRIVADLEGNHPRIDVIRPPADLHMGRLSHDGGKILDGFTFGVAAARDYLAASTARSGVGRRSVRPEKRAPHCNAAPNVE